MITASTDIDRFSIQLSTLLAAEKSSETTQCTRRIAGNDDHDHKYRILPDQGEISNTIPTSQLSANISSRTYNQ